MQKKWVFPAETSCRRMPFPAAKCTFLQKNAAFGGRITGNRRKSQAGFRAQESRALANFQKKISRNQAGRVCANCLCKLFLFGWVFLGGVPSLEFTSLTLNTFTQSHQYKQLSSRPWQSLSISLHSVPLPTIQSETWLVHVKVREPHLNQPGPYELSWLFP